MTSQPRPDGRDSKCVDMSTKGFIIRWKGWKREGDPDFIGLLRRSNHRKLVERKDAKVFETHDKAVSWCKKHVRNGHFKVDWRDYCVIEET